MATNYPSSLDSFTDKTALVDIIRASHINNIQDAIEAIEAELGTDPAGGYATVRTRLDGLTTITTVATGTTLTISNNVVIVNAASVSVTIYLPTAVGIAGKEFTIKRIDSSANTVTVDAFGTQTIDGELTVDLPGQWLYLRIISDGTNWFII